MSDWSGLPSFSTDMSFIRPASGDPGLELESFGGLEKDILICFKIDFSAASRYCSEKTVQWVNNDIFEK